MNSTFIENQTPTKSLWYNKHWLSKETKEFNNWWAKTYGNQEEFEDIEEFYRRKGFALMGWTAREKL